MAYEVGQVIFLLDSSEMKIFPARVEEEIVRRKVGSEEISYKVMLPNKNRSVVDLDSLDVAVFVTPEEIREHMVSNAVRSIDKIIEKAKSHARSLRMEEQDQEQHVREEDPVV